MESLIRHFVLVYEGFKPEPGRGAARRRKPEGRAIVLPYQRRLGKPYRMRVRGPSFVNMQALSQMVKGSLIADVIAAIGSLDIVLGEIEPIRVSKLPNT
ncbi:MAG: hypothetical protein R3B51_07780 [Thermodesulfobacteriota bacterium]